MTSRAERQAKYAVINASFDEVAIDAKSGIFWILDFVCLFAPVRLKFFPSMSLVELPI